MRIDPAVEGPTRDLLGHALRVEADDFQRVLSQVVDAGKLDDVLTLIARVAGLVVVDLCDGGAPTADDLQEIADTTAEIDEDYGLTSEDAHGFLSRVVFGGERLDSVFTPDNAARLPFVVASNLVGSTADVDNGQQWWDYLEDIEKRLEASEANP